MWKYLLENVTFELIKTKRIGLESRQRQDNNSGSDKHRHRG